MTSLKQLAMYCRDYIDLVSPSLLSRGAKQILIPKDILDATPLHERKEEFDYESIALELDLAPQLDQLSLEADIDGTGETEQVTTEAAPAEELSEEDKQKLEIAKSLDDMYRKYETSSYTKQITLRFGRVTFSAQPLTAESKDDGAAHSKAFKQIEQHLFSVPVTISFTDHGGLRHYKLIVDDTFVSTDASFLNDFLEQDARDDLFRFISHSESEDATALPLDAKYIDELWTKASWFLREAGAKDITKLPDMDNVIVTLLPKVNYFLSQDLLGIIDAADEEGLLETSLSAWVDEKDMSISEPSDDSGSRELFFPFPYDDSQLQVLGKLGNRAAVVEGPPGTGKSQTIANILCHLAATGKKVLFVSQKDQAIRGVKDKLKTLDIPYLYGYLPDRSSRLHSDEDEKDSAANALKGIAQVLHQVSKMPDPKLTLAELHTTKPQFNELLDKERQYFEMYQRHAELDAYDFGDDAPRITKEWHDELLALQATIQQEQRQLTAAEAEQARLVAAYEALEDEARRIAAKSAEATALYSSKTQYAWLQDEQTLLRNLQYADVASMMQNVLTTFETHAQDRKSNIFKSALSNMKLNKQLDAAINALPREMYESIRSIVFSDQTKTQRFKYLSEIQAYFAFKAKFNTDHQAADARAAEAKQTADNNQTAQQTQLDHLKQLSQQLTAIVLDDITMGRIERLVAQDGSRAFTLIQERYELDKQLAAYKAISPNTINELIKNQKQQYTSQVGTYIRNRLAERIEEYRQQRRYRAAIESIGKKLSKTKKAYKTFDSLKSNPENFEVMSGIIPIWMMGLDDASRVLPLAMNIFDYVIIDEASQCNISYALPAMYRSQHTILFGDTLQMRDTTTGFKSNKRLDALAAKHKIPEDLQIKATEESVKSVMDIAKLAGFQTTALHNHYRSPIELIGFSNENFYAPLGRRLQVVNDDILAMEDGRVLKNHVITANPASELSENTNLSEAYYIKQLIADIKADERTEGRSLAVLTFFNEQAELLRRVIPDDDVKISVIEGIQGDERDIVIYSFVIKSPQEKRRYVYLTGESGEINKEINAGRINVAFSRARLQVHAVTSIAPNLWPEGVWIKKYLEYVETHGRVTRHTKSEQQFDSKFEENVYDFLFSKLDLKTYTLDTQVESCGFRIDLVVRNIHTGKKLAIECDGPCHFEPGDGQVRVANDYERLAVLETAKWDFYHVIYSDWVQNQARHEKELLDYIAEYMEQLADRENGSSDDSDTASSQYTPVSVDIPSEYLASLKAEMQAKTANKRPAFGRKPGGENSDKEQTSLID